MNSIEQRIIELLNEGNDFDATREMICIEYKLSHGNYVHYFVKARQQMRAEG